MTSAKKVKLSGTALVIDKAKLNNKDKLIQVIPAEMLTQIVDAAAQAGHSVDEEVAFRLIATLVNPGAFGLSVLMDEIMNKKFSEMDVRAENDAREKGWMYVYQKEKLRLFIEFESRLPKQFKERFDLENLQEEIAEIRKEIEEKNKLEE